MRDGDAHLVRLPDMGLYTVVVLREAGRAGGDRGLPGGRDRPAPSGRRRGPGPGERLRGVRLGAGRVERRAPATSRCDRPRGERRRHRARRRGDRLRRRRPGRSGHQPRLRRLRGRQRRLLPGAGRRPARRGLAEPLACAANAVEPADVRLGDDVVIIGAGFMGNLVHQLVQLRGARQVIVADRRPDVLALAAALGATGSSTYRRGCRSCTTGGGRRHLRVHRNAGGAGRSAT